MSQELKIEKESKAKEEELNKNLIQINKVINYLCDIDMLNSLWNDENFLKILDDLDDRYFAGSDDNYYYSEDSEEVSVIRSKDAEWIGDNHCLVSINGEYYMFYVAAVDDGIKFWDRSKIKTDNIETARNVIKLASILEEMNH